MEQISETVMEYLIALQTLSKQKLGFKIKAPFSLGRYYRLICLEVLLFMEPPKPCRWQGCSYSVLFVTHSELDNKIEALSVAQCLKHQRCHPTYWHQFLDRLDNSYH